MKDKKNRSKVMKYGKWVPITIAIASALAALTPNDTDDKALKMINGILNATALNVMNAAPEQHKE